MSEAIFESAIRVRLADRPGALAQVASVIAQHGVNITRFEIAAWAAGSVWDHIQLAASEPDLLGDVVATLRRDGYKVLVLPHGWTIRDWGLDALRGLETVGGNHSPPETYRVVLEALTALTHCSRGILISDADNADDLGVDEAAASFDPASIRWFGDARAIGPVQSSLASTRQRRDATSGAGGSSGVAVILGREKFGPVLAAIGRRPAFLESEVERIRSWAVIAGGLITQAPHPSPTP